ncbi:pentatricopeptide repeat-containing protein At5g18950-like [Chenopodium quinoa]|uniref:pentatricopeptide repeat-containing protein At5g18950-like n=1 Tax=Chenopodium quinoa TaxID=63459 RepID=UPI000B783CF7|nr:pentatricopeptide repeat-containing protein At5g18950-like [Chenopodium quinoa]XP_021723633.1 pentatricopeptide repeat-containing protein At5g18950-like [Chenopodium quinoa]
MAKNVSFIISYLRQNPKPSFRHFSMISQPQNQIQEQQLITKIAGEVCEIIQTRPKWENTLSSLFPSFNFLDPRFFNEVLKLQKNAFFSIRLFNWLKSQSGYSPDPISCKSLFNALVESKASVVAKSIFDSYPKLFNPDSDSLESLICYLCNDGYVNEAVDLFEKLKLMGCCPSIVTWNTAFSGAVRVKRADIVWSLYGEMMNTVVVADVETVGYLIQACCIDNNVERGYELFRQIRNGGVVPDNVALNTLIRGLSINGMHDRVSELLHLMIETNHNPDTFTYQEIIHGLCKYGKLSEGYRIFNDLKARGYAPDRVMYTTMIHGFCKKKLLGKARELWVEMKKRGILPNEYTYNVLIHGYCLIHKLEEALKLVKEMCDRGCKLNTVNYNTLIAGLCKDRQIKEACELFEEMTQSGVARDVLTYNYLIQGLCMEGNVVKAQMLFEELLAHGLLPSTSSYAPLIKQLCRQGGTQQALKLLTDMVNRGVEPSIYNRECVIDGFCKEGLPIEGMNWLLEMLDRKLIPSRNIFLKLIICLLQQNELDSALVVLNFMVQVGYTPGEIPCRSLVSKFCSSGSNHVKLLLHDIISSSQLS